MSPSTVAIVDLATDDPRLPEMLEVLRHLRPELTLSAAARDLRRRIRQGLRFTVVEDGPDRRGGGWRLVACTTVGRRLYIDDLVTDPDVRSGGTW